MERSEPTLVPEWLRSGSVNGGATSTQHFASSRSDVPSSAYPLRNKSFKSINEFDSHRSTLLERSSSSNSRWCSASNGSPKHPYSSFDRSHRDRDWDGEKERSFIGGHWDADPLANMLTGRDVNSSLRHSRSMVSRNQGDLFPGRADTDSPNATSKTRRSGIGVLSTGSTGSSIKKTVFENDFPSLGTEERQGSPDIGWVPSPGLTPVAQSLLMSNTTLMNGDSWSALAEVPKLISSNTVATQLPHLSAVATPAAPLSGASGSAPGLNMAEALAQAPSRAQTVPQVSLETQRLEELAIRKSKQLIPVTPSMPKASMLNYSDKKAKTPIRSGEIITKSIQQAPSLLPASQSLRYGHVRTEPQKTPQVGKFLVLKPVRENGVSHSSKDVTSPTNSGVTTCQVSANSVSSATDSKVPNNTKVHAVERKASSLPLNVVTAAEKRPLSQAKSRSDFFNLMRKKSLTNPSTSLSDSDSALSSHTKEKSGELNNEVISDPVSLALTENGEMDSDGDALVEPDEEEAAFLRSLGWDENAGDEELTEEEINAFYLECMKLKPALLMCRGMQPKLSALPNMGGAEVNPSGPETEA